MTHSGNTLTLNLYALGVLMVIALAGITAAHAPTMAIGGTLLAVGGLSAIILIQRAAVLTTTLTCYGILISFQAFLPRRGEDQASPVSGGGLDARALSQLAIFALVLFVAACLWVIANIQLSDLRQFPLNILVPYSVFILVSILYTPEPPWPMYSLFKLGTILALLAVLSRIIVYEAQLKRAIDVMLGAITVVLVVFWLDVARGAAEQSAGRFRTEWMHPNHGTLLAVALLLALTVRFLVSPMMENRARNLSLAGFAAASAMAMGSKSSLGAAAIALLIATIVVIARKPTGPMLGRYLVLGMCGLGVIYYFIMNNLGIVSHLALYEQNTESGSLLTGRVPVWNTAISSTMSDPITMTIGHGYLSTFSTGIQGSYWVAKQAHNSFIQTFFDLGLFGVVIVIVLYIRTWVHAWQGVARFSIFDSRWTRALELFTVFTALTIVSFTEDLMGGTIENFSMVLLLTVLCIYKCLTVTPVAATTTSPDPDDQPAYAQPVNP